MRVDMRVRLDNSNRAHRDTMPGAEWASHGLLRHRPAKILKYAYINSSAAAVIKPHLTARAIWNIPHFSTRALRLRYD